MKKWIYGLIALDRWKLLLACIILAIMALLFQMWVLGIGFSDTGELRFFLLVYLIGSIAMGICTYFILGWRYEFIGRLLDFTPKDHFVLWEWIIVFFGVSAVWYILRVFWIILRGYMSFLF